MELWYKRPGRTWNEALPLGNGSLGVMSSGEVEHEILELNHDSLWSGYPRHTGNPGAQASLAATREAIRKQDWKGAEDHAKGLMGAYTESYLPMARLHLEQLHGDVWADYRRSLDLSTAIHRVSYRLGAEHYQRESFASFPHGVFAMLLSVSKPGTLNFDLRLEGRLEWDHIAPPTALGSLGQLRIGGWAPEHASPSYCNDPSPIGYLPQDRARSTRWVCGLSCQVLEDGSLESRPFGLKIRNATRVLIVLAADTSRTGYLSLPSTDMAEPARRVQERLARAGALGWDILKSSHQADHGALFGRVSLDLGPGADELPCNERIEKLGARDPGLCALLFQYGRYLLIASSRPGSLPANLQGIWNNEVRPPWSSNYTININTQMNYWPAWSTNLAECAQALGPFLEALAVQGEKVARDYFDCAGWCANHNTDAWAHAAPVGNFGQGDPVWAFWPLGGIWLTASLYESWVYDKNLSFLEKTLLPVMTGACLFALDWLVENKDGKLTTAPSTSPEHKFLGPDGQARAVGQGATIDLCLIEELFTRTRDLLVHHPDLYAGDKTLVSRLGHALEKLEKPGFQPDGSLAEWSGSPQGEDQEHRHLSHLYGIFPGSNWDPAGESKEAHAVLKALDLRGKGGTGWSLAWKIALRARFGQGDLALEHLATLLRPALPPDLHGHERGGVYPNLLDACPPFQIDGNFGASAAIALMLVQSRDSVIRLLPALPREWQTGSVSGLRLPGGLTVDIHWSGGTIRGARFLAKEAGIWTVESPGNPPKELRCSAHSEVDVTF